MLIKKCFLFTGKCLSLKAIRNWTEERGKRFADDEEVEVAETTVERLLCCGFPRTSKGMGQMYQCWWRMYREINVFFSGSIITNLTFYIHF
jgi:hypothetical protein